MTRARGGQTRRHAFAGRGPARIERRLENGTGSPGVGADLLKRLQDESLLPSVELILPPGWRRTKDFPEDGHLTITAAGNGAYDVVVDGATVGAELSL